jgi:replicative DNA helicase
MRELIKVLMERPSLLGGIEAEQVEDRMDFVIISLMVELHRQGVVPTVAALRDELRNMDGGEEYIDHLHLRMREEVQRDETYLLATLKADYNKRVVIQACTEGLRRIRVESGEEVSRFVQEHLRRLASVNAPTENRQAIRDTLAYLDRIYRGDIPPFWATDMHRLDKAWGVTSRMLVMVAAQQKIGKTRFVTNWILQVLKQKPDMNILWYSLEMHANEMIVLFIAWLTGIDSRVITGKSRMPTIGEQQVIHRAKEVLNDLPIKFFDRRKPTMNHLRRDVDKYLQDNTVVVIDNIGCIANPAGTDSVQFEGDTALGLVDMRDNTDACILALHHLNKESVSKWNKAEAYTPEVSHLRGSNKWADSVNMLSLLHRPDHYKSLRKSLGEDTWKKLQGKMLVNTPLGRDGPQDEVVMKYDLGLCRFTELVPE